MFSITSETIEWGGKTLTIEAGKMARQATGAVVVKYGSTVVLCTVVHSGKQAEDASFFPLTIHYLEKFYAAGKIPGGFMKREGKPSEREVLISRLIDRPIRPLFPSGFLDEVQIVCTTLSYDKGGSPDIAALVGASAALSISGIPFLGPIAGCRVGYTQKSGFSLNPTKESELDLIVAGTADGVLMVESEAEELSEDVMLDAVMFGFESFQPVIEMINKFKERIGKFATTLEPLHLRYKDATEKIEKGFAAKVKDAISIVEKAARLKAIDAARDEAREAFSDQKLGVIVDMLFERLVSNTMRSRVLEKNERIDGREPDQIRKISCEVDVLPMAHGSALFTRGETQALVAVTLGSSTDEQVVDDIEGDRRQRFMLHYNFPPYSVGETGKLGAPGRRETGHGKLAWRSLNAVIPPKDRFPYTVRIVSEILESNGSSSMATVCGASLSLMAAGAPIKSPVAGIAMGLVKDGAKYVILSDIMGDEDHLGDMDFKVAGTKHGITALQMDIKITGINREIMKVALKQAKDGRLHILGIMDKTVSKPRNELSDSAPRIKTITIDKMKIRDLIGPGGKVIREICDKTQAKIDIDDAGVVSVFASDKNCMDLAVAEIKSICCPPERGAIFDGKVVKITDFGAFVSIGHREGLVHISNIADYRIGSVSDVLDVGQEVRVKVVDIDNMGRIKLSMRDV